VVYNSKVTTFPSPGQGVKERIRKRYERERINWFLLLGCNHKEEEEKDIIREYEIQLLQMIEKKIGGLHEPDNED
jgi:hypothetical protein